MKGSVIVLDELQGRKAAARLVDGQLDDLLIDPDDDTPRPGAIFRAICDRPVKGQGGMFLRLPEGGSAFLRQAKGLSPGQPLLVQVTGWAEAGKAVPVTDRVLFKSRYAIITPGAPGINISRRMEAAEADEAAVADDIMAMRDLAQAVLADGDGKTPELLVEGADAHMLAWRDWPKPEQLEEGDGAFATHGVSDLISTIQRPDVAISGGALAFIEHTRAFVAVDVNTGNDSSPAAGLKANIALARALPRQLRCRGLAGQIVIDFAPMP
ncbi:MAG: ribonuclease E/G, partial [Maritimibacter sp.]